jgi:hypothetical protein
LLIYQPYGMVLLCLLSNIKYNTMRSLLYLVAVILLIGWVLGAFVWNAGNIIYILLILAIISFLLGVIRRGNV